jgi:hypothetical protein
MIIMQKTRQRAVYLSIYRRAGKSRYGVNIVTLGPPDKWHLDYVGQDLDEMGDYILTKLGSTRTSLNMRFREKYKIRNTPTGKQDAKSAIEFWDKCVAALERDYRKSRDRFSERIVLPGAQKVFGHSWALRCANAL